MTSLKQFDSNELGLANEARRQASSMTGSELFDWYQAKTAKHPPRHVTPAELTATVAVLMFRESVAGFHLIIEHRLKKAIISGEEL